MDKSLIRKENLLIRKGLNQEVASKKIVAKILSCSDFILAKNILIFYPLKSEINLLELINVEEKHFYIPKVFSDRLEICKYTCELEKSSFNIMEPKDPIIVEPSIIDVAFIPCLAIDKNLNRVGYGKGFYDRLFKEPKFRAKKIAVLNKELLVDKIDVFDIDVKVDKYITD